MIHPPLSLQTPIGRSIIVGDVHGCVRELEALLKEIRLDASKDRLLFIGDLINKGPFSKEAFRLFQSLPAISILGNHEYGLMKQVRGELAAKPSLPRIREAFGSDFDDLITSLDSWPRLIRLPGVLLVHGGVIPHETPEESDLFSLLNIRTWPDPETGKERPWFDLYHGSDLVVFGHWAALKGLWRDRVIGLDTGCVYGGKLSALILPERRLVQVSAKRTYVSPI